ncbi:probable ubiquitin carboxyl-terminal hydrolase MINDY-4 [Dermacentor silvarum]|uniref:probable ubiquitin carboxyl-terminal hydrolase MINDY-4 n=1 Tax=Dermacentor silvarum TaxID=543639 RepID=UPI0021010FB5|nr:probable ubiquitin carboxyl-terminal hydrolase MINDY-4 [Dermacentor silvarum]
MISRNMIETSSAYATASIQARCVEDVSCCIVREYLSRKGLKDTLAKMDKEFPRNEGCFTARDQLIKAAFMERLVRDNKARDSPFRALLEMLIYERLQKKSVKSKHGSKVNLVPSAGDSARHVEMNIRNNNCIPVALKEAKSESSDSLSSLEGALPVRTVADTDRPQSARGRREPGGFIVRRPARSDIESVHRLISKSQQYRGPTRVTNSAIQRMEEALKHEPGVHDGEGDRIDADHLLEKYGVTVHCILGGFEVDVPRRNAALARALAFILWQAGDSNKAIVANPTGVNVAQTDGILASDGIIETLTLSTFTSKVALQEYYSSCIFKLQEENCSSCVAFLISVLMTHGFERIREEMDERNSSLIGKHSHCNQEVVNLLLVGVAVTNVFDNKLCFGKEETTVLRGITSRSNIGLLSLYEHYKSCKVGSYYKDPKYPIWIVLSESHFSVLFAKSFLALAPEDEKFDLFYYDGLNKQEEEVRLTIDPTAGISNEDVVMTPPLELCIRTRWQGASVSWNNAEPLL